MHTLAAQLNFGAGAETCDAARDASLAGEELLDKYDFQAEGDYLLNNDRKVRGDYNRALELATTLDLYNNGELCVGPAVTIVTPNEGDTFVVGDSSPVTIIANAQDLNPITQVEFLVDGVLIGTDVDGSDGWSADWNWSGEADGEHVIQVRATNTLAETGTADRMVIVDLVPDVFMAVTGLSGEVLPQKGGKWEAIATATVSAALLPNGPVEGATVSGLWSSGESGSCMTDASGTCAIGLVNNKNTANVSFTVTDVTHATFVYDAASSTTTTVDFTSP